MLYKLKNKTTGLFYQKTKGNTWNLIDGKNYQINVWNDKGRTFETKKELDKTIEKITKGLAPTSIRPYPILSSITMEELEIVEI